MSNYSIEYVKLKDLCSFENGDRGSNYPSENDFVSFGIPFINGSSIDNNQIVKESLKYISKEKFYSLRAGKAKKKDILFSLRGSLNKCILCPFESAAIASALVIIRPNEKVSIDYLYLMLNTDFFKTQCKNFDNGSVQANLSVSIMQELVIPILNKEQQDLYVSLALSLYNKIQNNKKQIETLENLVKTTYDYWFVQFDFPNKEGKPYKSSGGKMVWNEELKREIPEGWNICKLKDLENEIITGKTPSTKHEEYYGRDIPFITIGDIRNNMYIVSTSQYLSVLGASTQQNKFIPENSLCVSCIATVGLIGISVRKAQTNQQINSVICKNKSTVHYLYFYLRDYFVNSSAVKSGNTFANMNKQEFSNISILFNPKLIDFFFLKTASIFEKIKKLSIENSVLIKQKEFLLPLLMNGQVQIRT